MAPNSIHVGKTSRRNLVQSEELTSVFYKLACSKIRERTIGATKLVKLLTEKQNGALAPCEEVAYSINRLVKGLPSSRKAARLGFFGALVEILKTFPEAVKTNDVIELAEQQLEIPGSKKNDLDVSLGHMLLYTALIRAERVNESDGVKKIVEGLRGCMQKTINLRTLVQATLSDLIAAAPEKIFRKVIYKEMEQDLTVGWETCSPYQLGLVMTVLECKKESYQKLGMADIWGKRLLSKKHYEHLKRVFLMATDTHPIIHPLIKKFVDSAMKSSSFQEFWMNVIDDGLVKATGNSKKFLAFEVTQYALSQASSAEQISVLLSTNLVQCYLSHLSISASLLHSVAASFGNQLYQFVQTSKLPDLQWAVINRIIESGTILVDHTSKRDVISKMAASLKGEACVNLLELLKNEVLRKGDQSDDDLRRSHSASLMCQLISSDTEITLHVLRFLALHSFFNIKKIDDNIPECSREAVDMKAGIRDQLQAYFLRALERLGSIKKAKKVGNTTDSEEEDQPKGWLTALAWQNEVVHSIVGYLNLLLSNPGVVEMTQPLSQQGRDGWGVIMKIVAKVSKHDSKMSADLLALKLFAMNIGVYLLVDTDRAAGLLQDLAECSTRVLATVRKASGDRKWVDVMMDLVLSVLCDGKHFLRSVAIVVAKQLVPHLSPENIDSVLKVLELGAEKGDLFESEDEEEEGQDEQEVKGDVVEEPTEEEEESSSDDETASESEIDDVDEEFKRKIQAAMGKAAHLDEEDEEIWDDEKMLKMNFDESVAEMFRNRKKSTKHKMSKKESMLLHFRLRTLDVIDVFIKAYPPLWMVLKMLPVLTSSLDHFAKLVLKHRQYMALMDRLRKTLTALLKAKIRRVDHVEDTVFTEALEEVFSVAERGKGAASDETISKVAAFILSCARFGENRQKQEVLGGEQAKLNETSQKLLDRYKSAVSDVFSGQSNLRFTLLKSLFQRHRDLAWSFQDVLLELAFNTDTKIYYRTEAILLLRVEILNHADVIKNVKDDEWKKFCKRLQKKAHYVITQLIGADKKVNPRGAYIDDILKVLQIVYKINQKKPNIVANEELLQSLCHFEVKGKQVKRLLNRILQMFPETLKQRQEINKQKRNELLEQEKQRKEQRQNEALTNGTNEENMEVEDIKEETETEKKNHKSKGQKRKKDRDESNWEKAKRRKRQLQKKNKKVNV